MKLKQFFFEFRTLALYYIFRIFPIDKNKAVFVNYNGKGYGCNPKYIAEEMIKRGNWKLVWLTSDMNNHFPSQIQKVKYNSIKSIYELSTAAIWVDNQRKLYYNRKRKKQYFLHTWHGAGIPLKKIGADNPNNKTNKPYQRTSKHMNKITNLMIVDSTAYVSAFRSAFLYKGEVLECGYPRNDILSEYHPNIKQTVYNALGIDSNYKTVLYAPTYRNGRETDMYTVDVERLLTTLSNRFGGEWIFLLRLHPSMRQKADQLIKNNANIYNASYYDDVQELLYSSDILISDYSSLITEFAVTGKPIFLYARDLNDYLMERDFYTNYSDLPFPFSDTNDLLCQNILNFDEHSYNTNVSSVLDKFGIIKTNNAAKVVVDRFEDWWRSI